MAHLPILSIEVQKNMSFESMGVTSSEGKFVFTGCISNFNSVLGISARLI